MAKSHNVQTRVTASQTRGGTITALTYHTGLPNPGVTNITWYQCSAIVTITTRKTVTNMCTNMWADVVDNGGHGRYYACGVEIRRINSAWRCFQVLSIYIWTFYFGTTCTCDLCLFNWLSSMLCSIIVLIYIYLLGRMISTESMFFSFFECIFIKQTSSRREYG